ncbi:MAG: peptidoglycan editing factor PgeF, partial [Candidatus Manganitrophaceae bacterium]
MGRPDFLKKAGRLVSPSLSAPEGYFTLPGLHHPGVFHFFGTRDLREMVGGRNGNRDLIDPMIPGTMPEMKGGPIRLRQVHGDQICDLREMVGGRNENHDLREMVGGRSGNHPVDEKTELTGDGLTTDRPRLMITVSTADCVPILLFDPVRRAVSAVHAGWRGTVLNISGKAVRAMTERYGSDPATLYAGIGPSIGPCCYEVGEEVWGEVERKYGAGSAVIRGDQGGKARLDLPRLNRFQLVEAGILADRISSSGLCTACLPEFFYSYRRDQGKRGNMISGIMLTERQPANEESVEGEAPSGSAG